MLARRRKRKGPRSSQRHEPPCLGGRMVRRNRPETTRSRPPPSLQCEGDLLASEIEIRWAHAERAAMDLRYKRQEHPPTPIHSHPPMASKRPSNRCLRPLGLPVILSFLLSCGEVPASRLHLEATRDPCSALHAQLRENARLVDPQGQGFPIVSSRPQDVAQCTTTVPFVRDRELQVLRSVVDCLRSFYALLHIARSSPDPRLPSSYDVVQELQSIGDRREWSSAEVFYNAVARAVDRLEDGHTVVVLGCPPFTHSLALPLVGVIEEGEQRVRVAPQSMFLDELNQIAMLPPFNFSALSYAEATVLLIEGQPAWEYMQRWAGQSAGVFHDQGQKTNFAFAHLSSRNGTRSVSYGAFGTRRYNPGRNGVRLVLSRNGSASAVEEVYVPWISHTLASNTDFFRDARTYFQSFCEAPTTSGDAVGASQRHTRGPPRATSPRGRRLAAQLRHRPQLSMMPSAGQQPLISRQSGPGPPHTAGKLISSSEDFFQVYSLIDGQTCVVKLSTFYPDIPVWTLEDFNQVALFFIAELKKAFALANRTSERVMIDLSTNGGGFTLLVPWATELLLGSDAFPGAPGLVETPCQYLADTEVVRQLRLQSLGDYDYQSHADLDERSFNASNGDAFFFPVRELAFGLQGVPGLYSNFFKNGFSSLGEALGSVKLPPAFGEKPIVLFSDGQCFSACSAFAIGLKKGFGIPMVSVGGSYQASMAFSAAGGGYVSGSVTDDILSSFNDIISALPDAPKPFAFNLDLALRWVNGFSTSKSNAIDLSAPIEFTFVPADVRTDYSFSNVVDPTLQYLEAAKAFFF